MKSRIVAALALMGFVAFANVFEVSAGPLYTWTDAKGVTHYSSSPKARDAKPAALPPIMRGEVKLAQAKVVSCDKHGGVDCRAGADSDGSVVCGDGFRDASLRFRFSCSSPKLEIADISPPGQDGSYSIYIRNHRSVTAQKMKVAVKQPDGVEALLAGPDQIEAYGLAEFQGIQAAGETFSGQKPSPADVTISCANCP